MTFSDLFGTWRIERVIGVAPISADEKSEREPLGKTVTISANLISTYQRSDDCKPRDPTVLEVNTEEKLEDGFGTKGAWLDLPKSALKPRLPYLDALCTTALVLNRNALVWSIGNGYIYLLKRRHR